MSTQNVSEVAHEQVNWTTIKDDFKQGKISEKRFLDVFSQQLIADEKLMNDKQELGTCGKYAPRMDSALDNATKIAHKLSLVTFPPSGKESKDLVWSYMKYQRLIAQLNKYYKDQEQRKIDLELAYKNARLNNSKEVREILKNRPLSLQITEPSAEPTTIAPEEEFIDLNKHLSANCKPSYNSVIGGCQAQQFIHGAIYEDKRLDLCKGKVGPTNAEKLFESLKNYTHVEHLLAGNNIMGDVGAKSISNLLKSEHTIKLKTLYLGGNDFGPDSAKILCGAIKSDPYIKYIWLKRNPLKPEGIKHIAELLKVNNNIEILDLNNCSVLNEGLQYLVSALEVNNSLKHLYLTANGITDIKCLANYFRNRKTKGITSLWIDTNRLGDGITDLIDSLKDYPWLKRLNIGANRMTSTSAKFVFETLVSHPRLEYLDLGTYKSVADVKEISNEIGDEGAVYAAEFIRKNKTVKLLNITHNDISEKGLEAVANALQENDTMLYLNYTQYGLVIPEETVTKFTNKLTMNQQRMGDKLESARFIKHSSNVLTIESGTRNVD
jgi:Ran GTPase-activating protein (RanGAP) involved in mRNA processing and transport